MALPENVRVRLSSEEAGAISLTQVVVQDMPTRELVEQMLPLAGKDLVRIREILLRGTLVSGASRFRWAGWQADQDALRELLASFPDPEPGRAFDPGRCVLAILRGARQTVEVPREAAARGPRRGGSFWDVLMEVSTAAAPRYGDYSYRHRADRFDIPVPAETAARLRAASASVIYTTLRDRIGRAEVMTLELYVER